MPQNIRSLYFGVIIISHFYLFTYTQSYVHFVGIWRANDGLFVLLSSRPHLQSQNVFDIDMFLCDSVDRDALLPRPLHIIWAAASPSFITTLTHMAINVLMHHTLRQAVQILFVINEYTDGEQPDTSNYPFILRSNELTNNICVLVYIQLFNFRFC